MLHTSKPSDSASDGSDLISTTNNREPFIVEMRFELSDAQYYPTTWRCAARCCICLCTVPQ
ncbi:hypothetical protein RHMOL_Rhmol10G0069900 [Rhododendron molle]|uniref:Uncharacterized protein n=1 Tax=Rhododendron molle TaxID=49168 RepID=A0ACC0LZW8_RHOML|nr:hypothetical protein RHMOL_Rhmol10G0069900 [Rhododendron molle]